MARHAEFTNDEIIEAGRALVSSGKRITGFGLRNAVGGGNPNRLMEVWENHQIDGSKDETEVISELPMELADYVERVTSSFTSQFKEQFSMLASETHNNSIKASERRLKEMTAAAEEMREKAKAEIEDATAAVDKSEDERDAAIGRASDLQTQLQASQDADRQKGFEIVQLKKDLAALEKASAKAAADAEKESNALKTEVQKLDGELSNSKGMASRLQGELDAATRQQESSKAEIAALRTDLAAKDQEIGKVSGQIESARTDLKEAKDNLAAAHKESRDLAGEVKSLQKSVAHGEQQVQALKDEVAKRDAEIANLKNQGKEQGKVNG